MAAAAKLFPFKFFFHHYHHDLLYCIFFIFKQIEKHGGNKTRYRITRSVLQKIYTGKRISSIRQFPKKFNTNQKKTKVIILIEYHSFHGSILIIDVRILVI